MSLLVSYSSSIFVISYLPDHILQIVPISERKK